MRRWALSLVVLLAADWIGAQLLVKAIPTIDVPRAEREKIERLYRVESDIYDHDLVPNFDGVGWWGPMRYPIRTNSLGFKDAAVRAVPLRGSSKRMLLIGDSVTEGIGYAYPQTFAGLIDAGMKSQGVEVLNAAVASYAPAIYFAKTRYLIEDAGLVFDELVVFLDISDIEDEARYYDLWPDGRVSRVVHNQPGLGPEPPLKPSGPRSSASRAPAPSVPVTWRQYLKQNSLLFRSYALAREGAWRNEGRTEVVTVPIGNPRRGFWTFSAADFNAYGRVGLDLAVQHMDRLADLVRAHNIRLTIAVYPWPDQVRHDGPDSVEVTRWKSWAEQHGARFVDLFAPFYTNTDRERTVERYFIPGDVHFNAAGHRLIADEFLNTRRP